MFRRLSTRVATVGRTWNAWRALHLRKGFTSHSSSSSSYSWGASLLVGASVLAGWSALKLRKALAAETVPLAGKPGTRFERTFIAIKPDGIERNLIAEIISRFEKRGYKLVAIKLVQPTENFAKEHYDDLKAKPFFPGLVKYFSSGPVLAMIWEGQDVILQGRKLIGATNPAQAEPGSIRGDLCIQTGRNIIHGSDSPEAASHEINLWFKANDALSYDPSTTKWIYEKV